MGISFKAFSEAVKYAIAVKKPILLRAAHGVGKSDMVRQIAKELGLKVVERRVSQMSDVGDILGLPKLTEKGTEWVLSTWVREAIDEPVVLFLDECDRGTQEVAQAIFQLTDSRCIGGHYLNEGTLIFAAINGGERGSQYQVREMDPAELDRWTVFDLSPTTEDWLSWAKDIIHPIVWDFINKNNVHLEHTSEFEPGKKYPSRRSWHRFSDVLKAGEEDLLPKQEGYINPALLNLANSFVGLEATVALGDFIKQYKYQLTVEDILDKGEIERTKNFQINDHLAWVEKFANSEYIKNSEQNKLSDNQITNIAKYLVSLPSEIAMKLFETITVTGIDNTKKIHAHKNPNVKEFLIKILTANIEKEKKEEKKKEKKEEDKEKETSSNTTNNKK